MSTVLHGPAGARPLGSAAWPVRVLLATFSVVLFLAPVSASAQTYFVDQTSASCSPAGPGTEAQPYCTITSALNAHSGPGITIRVKPGTYREQVTVPASGASGNPLIIIANGAGVIVDGADSYSTPAQWVLLSGNVYRAAAVTVAPAQVFKNGARLTPSAAAPASLPANSFTWVSGEGLYVNAGGGNPGGQQLLVGQRTYGFNANSRSWVTITGFTIRNAEDRGVNLGSCTNVVVSNNDVSFSNAYGIRLSGCTNITVQNNKVSKSNFHGIGLLASTTGCTITGNESFENVDPAVSRANGIYLTASTGNTVSANRTHHNQDTGILFTGGANNNISVNNVSYANGDHGMDHLASTGTIHNGDVAYGNFHDGFSIEGVASNTQLHNCISVDNGLTTGRYDLWVDGTSPGFVSDYNIIWNSTAQDPFKYISTPYATIAAYRTASGQDAHSLQSNPRFANGGGGDFRLLSNSPAIDAANSGSPNWPSTDAIGAARVNTASVPNTGAGPVLFADRGAFEFAGSQPPVVSAPATATVAENALLTVNVTASDPDGQAINSLTASGLPPGATFTTGGGNTSGTLTWTPTFPQAGTYNITFTATNALSGSTTTRVTVTHADRAPTVTAPATASVAEASLLTVNVTASDPDGDPITTLTASGLPAGATFTPGLGNATGTLSWTPSFTQSGTYSIIFIAANALTGRDTTVVTVTNTNAPPVVVAAPDTATVAEGSPLTINVTASDPDGSNINSLTASGVPSGASFNKNGQNTTGTFTWTPGFSQAGTYTVVFTASNSLTGRDTTVITVTNTDRAPVLTAPATRTVNENNQLQVSITAADADGDAITSLTATGLPPGATFAPGIGNTSGTVTWTPDFTQSGIYSITFFAANALADTAITQVTVTNVDRIPTVTAPATATVAENGPLAVSITVSDPDLDPITSLTAVGLPAGATFTPGAGNTTGLLTWTPGYAQSGSYNITFTASNALSGAATTQVTVTNVDRPPVVTAPPIATVNRNELLTLDIIASDPDAEAITSLTATGLPPGATFTPGAGNTTGTLSWTPAFSQSGSYNVTFTATNALTGSATTQVSINGTNRPPVVTAPATVSVAENELLTVNVATIDADGEPITSLTAATLPAGATFTPAPGNTGGTLSWTPSFSQSGSYAVTFTATNSLTGSATTQITVTGVDRAPVVTAPATVSVAENALLTVNVTATDPDGETITSLTAENLPPGATFTPGTGNTSGALTWTPGFSQSGSYTVSFIATNVLTGTAVTHVTVNGTDRPPIVFAPDTVNCFVGQLQTVKIQVMDPDGDFITLLTATGLPSGATFRRGVDNKSGTLTWTPSAVPAGPLAVVFTAQNAGTGSATTHLTVGILTAGVDGGGLQLAPRVVPNPIRDSGQLRFGISRDGAVRVDIFDLSGRVVATPMIEAQASAGEFVIPLGSPGWSAAPLSPGLYFYRVRTPDGTYRGRFMVRH